MKEGQRYIYLNPGCLFVQQPPKKGKESRGHLNYSASAYNRGRQVSHLKTKLNQIQQDTRINLNQAIKITQNERNKVNLDSIASYDLRPGNVVETILVES